MQPMARYASPPRVFLPSLMPPQPYRTPNPHRNQCPATLPVPLPPGFLVPLAQSSSRAQRTSVIDEVSPA